MLDMLVHATGWYRHIKFGKITITVLITGTFILLTLKNQSTFFIFKAATQTDKELGTILLLNNEVNILASLLFNT